MHINVMDRAAEWRRKPPKLDPANRRLKNNLDFFIELREEIGRGMTDQSTAPRAPRKF